MPRNRQVARKRARRAAPLIRLERVKKIYRMGKVSVEALRGVDLEVYPGEFVGIWGPSGSGKSTLMNMIGCLDKPTSGRVFIDGRDVSKLGDNALAVIRGKKIGFVFQQFNLLPNLTALENVALPLVFRGVPRKKREERAREVLEQVGLGNRLNFKPSELSGGQQQRVAIARALAVDPEVILADEPTGNVDTTTSEKIMDLFERLNREMGKTIILVTHDPEIIERVDRVIKIRDGRIVGDESRKKG